MKQITDRSIALSPHFRASRTQTMFSACWSLFRAAALILFSFHLVYGQTRRPRGSNIRECSPEYGTQLNRASCLSALVQMHRETNKIFYHIGYKLHTTDSTSQTPAHRSFGGLGGTVSVCHISSFGFLRKHPSFHFPADTIFRVNLLPSRLLVVKLGCKITVDAAPASSTVAAHLTSYARWFSRNGEAEY